VRALLQTLESTPVDSLSFHKAIQGYVAALLRGQELRLEALGRWLHGEEVSPEDMRDLRSIGVTEKINKNNAFKMLRSLCQVVRRSWLHGAGAVVRRRRPHAERGRQIRKSGDR
jgi:hypothetical protein